MSPRGPASVQQQEIFCRAKFVRRQGKRNQKSKKSLSSKFIACRFVEVDDELISVITDVEEDDLGSTTGYHNALPLEVHKFTF